MSFSADVLRVLIASPGDLAEERNVAERAINDWNSQHSEAEGVVLLPLRWETGTRPVSNVRPQGAINEQIVTPADILVGMFWTKFGTSTGIAESGTVEEINSIIIEGKPALLYFSNRPIDPSKIQPEQFAKLSEFKKETYKNALVGSFSDLGQLREILLRDLLSEVRQLRRPKRRQRRSTIDKARELTELIALQKKMDVSLDEFKAYSDQFATLSRTKSQMHEPVSSDEKGPNGYKIGHDEDGNKVEWIPSDEGPEEFWPMILRRNDKDIVAAYNEFWDKVWWNRHQNWIYRINNGEPVREEQKEILETAKKAARRIERKYGKKNLGWDDFEWGLLSGKMSALSWVLGSDWEESLDT